MSRIRIAEHIEIGWLNQKFSPAVCPNCGVAGPVQQYLEIDYKPPDADHFFTLQICPHCSARFVDNPETMDYATDLLIEIGWHVYQIQLGAGVWPITAPLTRIQKPAGARILEIGGAYGFGLDFCRRARGWDGEGFDPSPLAEFGARALGLAIVQDYFEEKDVSRGPYDVVMGTEVIEHLPVPPAFFALMRRVVAEDGILLLTTPDAEWITPGLAATELMPLLSPGAHVVLQTAASLETALHAAGFAHVAIIRESMSLIAYASPSPFVLTSDPAAGRAMYRHYLVERSKLTTPESDLCLGFAGRGLFEAANDGDDEAAELAWATLLPAAKARFGIDLATIASLPEGAATADLALLGRLIPLGLGTILFGRAMHLLARGTGRSELLPIFRLSIKAIDALQDALAKRSLTDGLSASIRRVAEAEVALCLAEAGAAEAVPQLIALAGAGVPAVVPWQGFIGLVNAGAFGHAKALQEALTLDWPDDAMPADLRADILATLANLALAPGEDAGAALPAADALLALQHDQTIHDALVLAAFTRLVNASRFEEAKAAGAKYGSERLIAGATGEAARDGRIAAIVLAFGSGETEDAAAQILALNTSPGDDKVLDGLYVDAFVRLVNESRFGVATQLAANRGVERRLGPLTLESRLDALAALLVLELQPGGAAVRIPQLIEALLEAKMAEERFQNLLFASFVTLVNAPDFGTAKLLLNLVAPALRRLTAPYEPGGRNVLFAFGVLSLNDRDNLPGAAAAFRRLRDDIVKRTPDGASPDALFWPAMRGEVLALNELRRKEEAITLLELYAARFAGAPDDLLAMLLPPAKVPSKR